LNGKGVGDEDTPQSLGLKKDGTIFNAEFAEAVVILVRDTVS
jgi:hypothetical protein